MSPAPGEMDEQQESALMLLMAGFFDAAWYEQRYPDIRNAKVEALPHFIRYGVHERRDPNRFFDGAWYLEHYPDVAASGQHPLLHYLEAGAAELRNPHPRFDAIWYAEQHPDASANPLLYHLRIGAARGYVTEKSLYIQHYLPSEQPLLPVPADRVVDVVIPVYLGLKETRACLQSVLADTAHPLGQIIVVNDRSPDPKLCAYLDKLATAGRIKLVRNRRNLGFVSSVNAGMNVAGDRDVVLLNSDTEVPSGWLGRLVAHAYADARIATVSPLSNNATICGYPDDQGGPIVFGAALSEVDDLCRATNAGRSVQTPTTVGFCMYIRRDALREVGEFDAERFGLGYGEENDFCLRATALGWQHRIACDIFVYHKGSVSFGARAEAMAKRAMGRLLEQHPAYAHLVAVHVKLDSIGPYRFALTAALLRRSGLPVILMVSHELGGGIRQHIDTLVKRLAGKAHVLSLEPSPRGVVLSVPALAGHPRLVIPAERLEDLAKMLRNCGVSRVHLHHLMGMDLDVRLLIHRLNVPFDFTVHDYFPICPQVNLLPQPTAFYCNEPAMAGCNACIAARPSHGARDILSWRAERAWPFKEADRVFCPSVDVLTRLQRHGLDSRAIVAPHEPVTDPVWPSAVVSPAGKKLRIAVLGVLADHKGARTVASVAEQIDPRATEIYLIGHVEDSFPKAALPRLKITGEYKEEELAGLIETIAPNVLWFPAVWPETFSYTLSAAIASGLPVVATHIGAFPERLAGRPLTWLTDHMTSPTGWISIFNDIRTQLAETPCLAPDQRNPVDDFYAHDYVSPPGASRPCYPMRVATRHSRPVIAVVPECYDNGGPTPCGYIRLLQPLYHDAIAQDFDILLADPKSIFDYSVDIILTHRSAIPDVKTADALMRHARDTKATLVYDLDDDLLRVAPNHPEAAELRPFGKTVRRMLNHVDAVWVSTPALAHSLRAMRPNVTVVPNGLDERLWSAPLLRDHRPHQPTRILCMGTTTHHHDFAMIIPALARIKEEFGGIVEIDIIGMSNEAELPVGFNRVGLPNNAFQSYPGFVNWLTTQLPGWHIGLAPLLETPFNLCKSAIKTMDYAALGLAVLASDIPVYHSSIADGPAGHLVANNHAAWYAALNWLVRNPDLRRSMAAGARPAFLAHASLASQAEARRNILLGLLHHRQAESAA